MVMFLCWTGCLQICSMCWMYVGYMLEPCQIKLGDKKHTPLELELVVTMEECQPWFWKNWGTWFLQGTSPREFPILVVFYPNEAMSQVQTVHCNSVLGALKRARHWQHALWMFQHLPGPWCHLVPEFGQPWLNFRHGKFWAVDEPRSIWIQHDPNTSSGSKEHDIGVLQRMLRSLRIQREKDSGKLRTCLGYFGIFLTQGHRWHRVLTTIL